MALGTSIAIVELLEQLKAGNYLRTRRVTAYNIKALAQAWLDIEVTPDDIRDTLAAAYLEIKTKPYGYDVAEICEALEPDGMLQQLANRAKEDPNWL